MSQCTAKELLDQGESEPEAGTAVVPFGQSCANRKEGRRRQARAAGTSRLILERKWPRVCNDDDDDDGRLFCFRGRSETSQHALKTLIKSAPGPHRKGGEPFTITKEVPIRRVGA